MQLSLLCQRQSSKVDGKDILGSRLDVNEAKVEARLRVQNNFPGFGRHQYEKSH